MKPTPAAIKRPLPWLWLVVGMALFVVSNGRWIVPLAAWLAPIALLLFVHRAPARGLALLFLLLFAAARIMLDGIIPSHLGALTWGLTAYYALLWFLPYAVDRGLASRLPGVLSTLVFPATAVSAEYASTVFFGSWGSIAYSQMDHLPLVQLASVTGMWGITFLVLWTASVVVRIREGALTGRSARRAGVAVALTVAGVLLFGGLRLTFAPEGEVAKVVGLTPTTELDGIREAVAQRGQASVVALARADRAALGAILEQAYPAVFDRTRAAAEGAQVVLWAESMIAVLEEHEPRFLEQASAVAAETGAYLLLGYLRLPSTDPGRGARNTATLIAPDGEVVWSYLKAHPVPGSTDVAGDGRLPVTETPFGRIATAICYDMDFTGLIVPAGRAGVDLMLVPAWDWKAIDPLHARMASLRAVENGFSMVRETGEGRSVAVDTRGRVLAEKDWFSAPDGTLAAWVPTRGSWTPYRLIGDAFAWLNAAFLLFAVARLGRRAAALLLLPLPLLGAACAHQPPELSVRTQVRPPLADQVIIRRDPFGVAHVRGETDAAAVFGFVYARAEDEFERIERSLLVTSGEAARHYGEEGLAYDVLVELYEVERRAREEYARMDPGIRALCDAAAEALEYYAALHVPAEERRIPRFEGRHFVAAAYSFPLALAQGVQAGLPDSPLRRLGVTPTPTPTTLDGSNAWALGPSRTRGANALLFVNPHIPLDEVYEGHIASETGWNLSGMTAYGSGLFPIIGFNEQLGWTLTVNHPDVIDAWRITFDDPERPDHYRYGDGHREAERWTASFAVKTDDGLETREVELRRTVHGPILGQAYGAPVAVQVAGFDRGGSIEQLYAMGKARSFEEFREALRQTALVFHNVIYADRDGHIYYVYNAVMPKRPAGHAWAMVVDGSDPEAVWDGYHALDELPQVLDPEAGFVQSCNSSPLTTTRGDDNPRREDFPPYMIGRDRDDPRVNMSYRLIESREAHNLGQLVRLAFDNYAFEADRWIPAMRRSAGDVDDPRLEEALVLLEGWDRRVTPDSEAATVFVTWAERNYQGILFDTLKEQAAARTLVATLDALTEELGGWRRRWGDVVRHQRPALAAEAPFSDERESWEIPAGHAGAGLNFNYMARSVGGSERRYGYHGHSYVAVVAFGNRVAGLTIVPYGQSRDPDSPHHLDQAGRYVRGELKPAWLYEDDVLKATVRSYRPGD